jgi:integrase
MSGDHFQPDPPDDLLRWNENLAEHVDVFPPQTPPGEASFVTLENILHTIAQWYLRTAHRELHGTVFHSTRKWFITQCERTGVPEHFTASLVGHQSARSENKLTYGLYSAGISDTQKREIIDQVRLPQDVLL